MLQKNSAENQAFEGYTLFGPYVTNPNQYDFSR
jgi:hypothetical protein